MIWGGRPCYCVIATLILFVPDTANPLKDTVMGYGIGYHIWIQTGVCMVIFLYEQAPMWDKKFYHVEISLLRWIFTFHLYANKYCYCLIYIISVRQFHLLKSNRNVVKGLAVQGARLIVNKTRVFFQYWRHEVVQHVSLIPTALLFVHAIMELWIAGIKGWRHYRLPFRPTSLKCKSI